MIAPLVMLIISYVFMILIFARRKICTHIINEDYEWFRRYGILRCSICLRWSYLYIYYLIA